MYLLTPTRYAPFGAEVSIISKPHDTVWICEYEGNRFPCSPWKLGEERPEVEVTIEVKPVDLFNQPLL